MKMQRMVAAHVGLNAALLAVVIAQAGRVEAEGGVGILRGRALEIVDDRGRVRASIKLHPADPSFLMPNGKRGYPETVVLRLIDTNGRPGIKVAASADGAGMSIADSEKEAWCGIQLLAEEDRSQIKLTSRNGRQQIIAP